MDGKSKPEVEKRAETAPAEQTRSEPHFTPAADIVETAESLVVLMDMPGVGKDDVEVGLDQGVLSVFGRARSRKLDEGFRPVYAEYQPGHYQRSFQLGDEIDAEKIEASMRDGVLRLVLPKSAGAQARRIEIK